jgi:PAS domain S-box-containing protein
MWKGEELHNASPNARGAGRLPTQLRKVEGREWWLWGFVVAVTLGLTFAVICLTFPAFDWKDELYSHNLREWVRALAALVLLFDLYSIYQHLQLQRFRQRLWEKEQLFQLITENAVDMIAVIDREGHRLYNSPAYQKVLGYTTDELASTSSVEQVHPDDRERVTQAAQKAYRNGRADPLEYRIRHKDGSWRVLESTASAIPGPDGELKGLVIVNRDVTDRKRAEALLEHRALHDGLTNLPNRVLLLDRLQRAIEVSHRHRDFRFAVFYIGIDNFKVFNDSLGHAAGDELLIQIARRLTACLRSADTVARDRSRTTDLMPPDTTLARPCGDEFVVFAAELRNPSDAIRMAKRMQERLAIPFAVNSKEIIVSASVGIVFCNADSGAATSEDVLRDAEIAMYRAKRAGKGSFQVFDNGMQTAAVKRLELETDLRRALEAAEFRIHYQPIVSLVSGNIVGFEALTRWQRPEGMLPPAEFMGVATETGLILPMNRELLRQACFQIRRWQGLFPSLTPLGISVNVTAPEFAQPDFSMNIREVLDQTGVNPAQVTVEITETIAMADPERSLSTLVQLSDLGVRLSLDDFGTGFSSLYRLQQFPFHSLKVDRSFVSQMLDAPETLEIVRIILMLAQNLSMKAVAEGIEHPEQVKVLRDLGCELGQGYLFSRPVSAEKLEVLLQEYATCGTFSHGGLNLNLQDEQEVTNLRPSRP